MKKRIVYATSLSGAMLGLSLVGTIQSISDKNYYAAFAWFSNLLSQYEVLDKTLLGFIYKEEKAGQFLFTNITQIRVFDSSI